MIKGLLWGCFFLFNVHFAAGFAREQLSFKTQSGRRLKDFFMVKNSITAITGKDGKKIATVTSNPMRSEIEYHIPQLTPQVLSTEEMQQESIQQAWSKLASIRNFPNVFDDIGFPQVGMVIRWNGSLYALLFLTVEEMQPEQVAGIASDDPAVTGPFYENIRQRLGVSGGYGSAFVGISAPWPIDSAVLVNLDEAIPMVLKVYDMPPALRSADTLGLQMDFQRVVGEYAYFELKTNLAELELCEAKL